MDSVSTQVQKVKQNIDWRIVTSNVVSVIVIGGLAYMGMKSGVRVIADVSKTATGNK